MAMLVALVAVASLAAGCADKGPSAEVDEGDEPDVTAPSFPDNGDVPRDLLVAGIVFDLSNRPDDLNYWAAPVDQAECAATKVVDELGAARLSELGYRPGVPGASLNDIELSETERSTVVDAVEDCVDMVEAVAAMLLGDGRLKPSVATCVAGGLADKDQLRPFVAAVVFGTSVDPFAGDSPLAPDLLDQAVVCVPADAFDGYDLELPDAAPTTAPGAAASTTVAP